jgi:tRNA(fMet)-specific endonuclease VapC
MMYVLDTNTLIYFFKGVGSVAYNLLHVPPRDIGIPSIVLYELQTGIAKSNSSKKRLGQFNEMVSLVNLLDFSEKEAVASAKIRAELEKKGTPIGPLDTLIAGTALAQQQGVLVTHNTKEFGRIKNLKVIDWYRSRETK